MAIGSLNLPVNDAPGFGGLLLGGIIARYSTVLDDDMLADLHDLTIDVERGMRIPQPRLRHRLQADRVGLLRSRHRLIRTEQGVEFRFDDHHDAPAQNVLAAVYAARHIPYEKRRLVMPLLRRAIGWPGEVEDHDRLISHLTSGNAAFALSMANHNDPLSWALEILEIERSDASDRAGVQRQFRRLLRTAHPDTAKQESDAQDPEAVAAQRIAELTEARRILLAGA